MLHPVAVFLWRVSRTIALHMKTATAAASAAGRRVADTSQSAGRRLRELAANLSSHGGFAEVVASLEAGHGGTLGGVWGSSRALVAAALARSCPGPLVVIAPHQSEIEAIARDLALFTEAVVAEFPAWEAEPGERVIHDEVYGQRLRVLKAIADCGMPIADSNSQSEIRNPKSEIPAIVVTSIQSLLQPVPSPQALAAATREIRVGGRLDEQEVARWL